MVEGEKNKENSSGGEPLNNDEDSIPTIGKENTNEDPFSVAPYSNLFHPNKSWIDIFVSILIQLFFPVAKVALHPANAESEGAQKIVKKLRDAMVKNEAGLCAMHVSSWTKLSQCEGIVECELPFPLKTNLLVDWGVLTKEELPDAEGDQVVQTVVHYPSSLFPRKDIPTQKTRFGVLEGDKIAMEEIPLDVPIVVWFHGGGLNIGHARDPFSVELVVDALQEKQQQQQKGDQKKEKEAAAPVVTVSVEYRLAPEHPFPAAIMDALSVATALLDENPERKLHLAGASAGGNLAIVTAMEMYRQYPGRIKSVFAYAPMFNPAADSISYHMNSTSSGACPVEFLRWCWRSYLVLEEESDRNNSDDVPIIGADEKPSNSQQWDKCPWKTSTARRLIEPYVALPANLNRADDAPKIVVGTNSADPLENDGIQLVDALRAADCKNVTWINAKGSHMFAFSFDAEAKKRMKEELASALLGSCV